MALGPNTLQQFALPTYWDAATLEKYRLVTGETYDQLVADIGAALSLANGDVLSDPLNSSLISITTDLAAEYETGTSNGFQTHTEFSRPDNKRGATTGHMLPLVGYDRGLGWTWDMLRRARRSQIDTDVASAIRDLKDVWQKQILTRLFKSTYTAVGSGRSMPLADGGTADTAYVPLPRPDRGGTFLYTHDHIVNYAAVSQANLETVIGNLWEHGADPPYDLLVSQADLGTWTATGTITGYVPPASSLIRYGATADVADVDRANFLGVIDTKYGSVRLRATGRLATTYWAAYKSYGPLDPRNPLVVRVGVDYGASATLLRGDHIREFPLEEAIIFVEFGVAVANRVGAVAAKTDAGSYADPTVS